MDKELQPDPADTRLARELAAGDASHASVQDPLLEVLLPYRRLARTHEPVDESRIWQRIETATVRDRESPLRLLRVPPRYFAAAAAVAALIAVAFLLVRPEPTERLLAEAAAERLSVRLADGSQVQLRAHSRLYERGPRAYRIEGEALFQVVSSGAEEPFEVIAEAGRVVVLGTRFAVRTWKGEVEVDVLEGLVRFEDRETGAAVELAGGEQSILRRTGAPSPPATLDVAESAGWLFGELRFRHRSLGSILAEIEHHFNVRIEGALPLEETYSGIIPLETIDQVLSDLSLLVGGRFEKVGEATYRFRRNA
jgi:transmembrane sensor